MHAQPDKQPDQKQIVASLAARCHVPIAEVAPLYERQRAELASAARVTKFMHIFVARNVVEILRKRALESSASGASGPSGAARG